MKEKNDLWSVMSHQQMSVSNKLTYTAVKYADSERTHKQW
jgi:hypothetical protein